MTSNIMNNLFLKRNPEDWKRFFLEFDYPTYTEQSVACLVVTFTMIMTPGWLGEWLIETFVAGSFHTDAMHFALKTYLPMIKKAVKNVSLSTYQWLNLARQATGAYLKFMFGLTFNEDIGTPYEWIKPISGGFSIWFVNMIADILSDMY